MTEYPAGHINRQAYDQRAADRKDGETWIEYCERQSQERDRPVGELTESELREIIREEITKAFGEGDVSQEDT